MGHHDRPRVDRDDDALAAEFLRAFGDQLRSQNRCRIDGYLVRAFSQDRAHVVNCANSAADRKRNEDVLRDPPHHIRDSVPCIACRRDIQKYQLIRTCGGIRCSGLDRIPGVPQLYKIDALYDAPVFYIQAGNNSLSEHVSSAMVDF